MAAQGSGDAPKPIPVTMLSGFLGAGKTTLLRHVLTNSDLKVGCIVNDVAAVNIDAKLLRGAGGPKEGGAATTSDLADTIELANGCACCSIADELFGSFENLLALADKRGVPYDRIILENSGVAEPQNIRDQFNDAAAEGQPITRRVYLDSLVTVVDSHTFITDYSSRGALAARPDLGDGGGLRPVVDLLVEQIEVADYVVLNKIDMMTGPTVDSLTAIVASLNPLAQVVKCEHGRVPIKQLFGEGAQALVSKLNIEGQHRGAVAAARTLEAEEEAAAEEAAAQHEHKHHHHHGEGHDGCKACEQEGAGGGEGGSHHHEHHHHEHKHGHKHEHKHEHKHGEGDDCAACKHEGDHAGHHHTDHHHHHHHAADGHKHDDCAACEHEGHEHHHHHHTHTHKKRARQETTAAQRFGIKSFVYARRRPFHPQRLKDLVLRWMPVSHNKAIGDAKPEQGESPIKTVLRSKGFMWIANSHTTAFYWSHAGQHFEIRDEGEWWVAVPEADWPAHEQQRGVILADFDAAGEYGDRRQEIVFIGAGMERAAIEAQLDSALLTDKEMEQYRGNYASQPDPAHTGYDTLKAQRQPQAGA